MKVWSIRHKATGEWMPARMNRQGRGGWSWWIPGPTLDGLASCGGFDKNPRVFFSKVSAQRAAANWVRGPMFQERHYTGGSVFEPPEEYTTIEVEHNPAIPARASGDLEIVEGELTL